MVVQTDRKTDKETGSQANRQTHKSANIFNKFYWQIFIGFVY